MSETYVVVGASGNTGRRVANALLAAGKRVRAVTRSARRVEELTRRGAVAVTASLADAEELKRAFDGADAAYVMVPPIDYANPQCDLAGQDRISEALVAAVRGVPRIVNLSSLGADRAGMMEQVDSLRRHEQRLRTVTGLHVLHLRPGFFMEGLLDQVPMVAQAGMFAYPVDGSVKIPMIAAADIARIAAERLLALDFEGESAIELPGPRDVSMEEAATICGRAAGIADLPYFQVPFDQFRWSLERAGLKREVIEVLIATNRFLSEGKFVASQPRRGFERVTIEEFARSEFLQRFVTGVGNTHV